MPLDWIRFIPIEVRGIDNYIEPAEEIKPEDEVLGHLDDDLKRLWTLRILWQQKANDLASNINLSVIPNNDESRGKLQEAMAKAHVLYELFWLSLQDYMRTWDIQGYHLGVRAGFAVVKFKSQGHTIFGLSFGEHPYG